MNCQLCHEEFDAYLDGKLDPGIKDQVELHLRECRECNEFYRIQTLVERVIKAEKELTVNPFLATRIIAQIENSELRKVAGLQRLLRPALIAVSMAAAIFAGVMIGNIPLRNQIDKSLPVEFALIDDARLESINLLSTD